MKHRWSTGSLAAAAWALSCGKAAAALTLADIQFWAGVPDGPSVSRAAVVIDWGDGQSPLAWGFRWDSATRMTSREMFAAIVGADPRLHLSGLDGGFLSHFAFDGNLDGAPERFRPGFIPATGEFWAFFVNNDVFYHPTDFSLNSHIVPPNTAVLPNGDPFAAVNPGTWIASSTGVGGRELADGSWDGFAYNTGSAGPLEPRPVAPIPEPAAGMLACAGLFLLLRRAPVRSLALLGIAGTAAAGPYPPAAGKPGSTAVPAASPAFVEWASAVASVQRGWQQITDQSLGRADYDGGLGNAAVLGPSDVTAADPWNVMSLGDGGQITLTFPQPIGNGPGADFAVFENGFSYTSANAFLELAFVEVSSNGTDFFRFPAVSLTPSTTQIPPFEAVNGIDPTNLHNLAGKYVAGNGTPFDLEELRLASPLLNVNRVTHVRVVDVIGTIDPAHATRDAQGRIVNDPWPVPYPESGFDLDAVGVMHMTKTGFQLWRDRQFTVAQLADAAVSGPLADPDKDGMGNLIEYGLDADPLRANAGLTPLRTSWASGQLALQFSRFPGNTDLTYTLERSADGAAWTAVARSTLGAATANLQAGGGVTVQESAATVPVTVTVRIPRTMPAAFFRLRISTGAP
jgi:hypothetical protein